MRVEEIEESDDDDDGVDLDPRYQGRRFASDELQFTGIDLGNRDTRRRRKKSAYDEDSDDPEDEDYIPGSEDMQLMLREKEDLLVERALERMRRARELGKTNVKLTRAEIDALERAERRQSQRITVPLPKPVKGKKAVQTRPKLADKKQSSRSDRSSGNSPAPKAIEPRRGGKSSASAREPAQAPYPTLPDESYGLGNGALVYAPQGYYGAPVVRPSSSSSRPGSRTASSQSLRPQQSQTPPLAQYQHPYQQGRYFSNPDTYPGHPAPGGTPAYARPDPSDPNWEPRTRSNSSLVSYPIEQFNHGTYLSQGPAPPRFDPNDPRFASPQAKRVTSGPPDIYMANPSIYRQPQDQHMYPLTNGMHASRYEVDRTSDEDGGMQVEVTEKPGGDYGVVTRASASTAAGNKGRGGGQAKRGPARRTR